MSTHPIGINVTDESTRQSLTTRTSGGHITLEISTNDDTTHHVIVSRLHDALRNLGDGAHFQLTSELSHTTKFDNDLF